MGQTVTALANAGMLVYDKVVHDQVFSKNVLFMNILKNVATTQGSTTKYITYHYGRNISTIAGGETVTLPSAGQQSYLQGTVSMKYQFAQVSLTDVVLEASKKSPEFLVNALTSEYEGVKNDMTRQLSRQGYGIGTGVICQINGVGSTPTFDLDNPMVGKNPTDYLQAGATGIGSPIMLSASATAESSASFGTVSAIVDGNTMTMAADNGVADNDYLFLAHYNASATPTVSNLNSEIMGLKGLVDDGTNVTTFQGLSRSTYTWLQSYVDDASSQRSLSENLMHNTMLEAKKKGNPSMGLTSFDVVSAYGQLLTSDRRYTSDMKVAGGFTGVSFNGLPLVPDYDAPYDELYWLDTSTLSVEDLAPMSFLNADGAILDRSTTTPAWNATLKYYMNLANKAPNKSAALRDIVK